MDNKERIKEMIEKIEDERILFVLESLLNGYLNNKKEGK